MKDKTALAIMLTLLFVSFLAGIHTAKAQGTPRVYLNPTIISASPGKSFSVDVVLEDAANVFGWEFKLFWNNFILECIADVVHVPVGLNWEDPNHIELGPGIEQDYNATQGRYFRGFGPIPMQEPYPTPFNGTTILVTLTFNVKANGSCVLDLGDTKLAHFDVYPIEHNAEDGYFRSQSTEMANYLRACAAIATAFGATPEEPGWKPFADINVDSTIDIYDIVLVAGKIEEIA